MSRVIKFRAWDGNKMYLPEYSDDTDFVIMPDGDICEYHEVGYERHLLRFKRDQKWIIMQFTGLHDKNGKEIYEGDVVKLFVDGEVLRYTYIVKWIDFGYKLVHATPHLEEMVWGGLHRIAELSWEAEVIGNIYENPELLQEKGGEG